MGRPGQTSASPSLAELLPLGWDPLSWGNPLGLLPEAPALRFPEQDETGGQAGHHQLSPNPAEKWRGDAAAAEGRVALAEALGQLRDGGG